MDSGGTEDVVTIALDLAESQFSDTWTHYALTYNNGNFTAYLDSKVVGSYGVNRANINPNTLVLGAASGSMPSVAFDDVRTFSNTLTGWDVAELYNAGAGTEDSCNGTTTTTTPAPTTAPPPIPLTYLTHYWKFDRNTYDYYAVINSTGGQDWLSSGLTAFEVGKINYAISTSSTYLSSLIYDCNFFSLLPRASYSWAMWLRVNADSNGTILANEGTLDLNINYVQNGVGYDLRFGTETFKAGLSYGVWYSLVISTIYNGTTINTSCYVNDNPPVSYAVFSTSHTLATVFLGRSLDLQSFSSISVCELRFYETYLTTSDAFSFYSFGNGYSIPCNDPTTITTVSPTTTTTAAP